VLMAPVPEGLPVLMAPVPEGLPVLLTPDGLPVLAPLPERSPLLLLDASSAVLPPPPPDAPDVGGASAPPELGGPLASLGWGPGLPPGLVSSTDPLPVATPEEFALPEESAVAAILVLSLPEAVPDAFPSPSGPSKSMTFEPPSPPDAKSTLGNEHE
jgi:hypothetical protein